MNDRLDRMEDRLDRVEIQQRDDNKQINEKLTGIVESLATLTAKQNMGSWIFKLAITVVVASLTGWCGAHLSK